MVTSSDAMIPFYLHHYPKVAACSPALRTARVRGYWPFGQYAPFALLWLAPYAGLFLFISHKNPYTIPLYRRSMERLSLPSLPISRFPNRAFPNCELRIS